jgi:hypothetical protein
LVVGAVDAAVGAVVVVAVVGAVDAVVGAVAGAVVVVVTFVVAAEPPPTVVSPGCDPDGASGMACCTPRAPRRAEITKPSYTTCGNTYKYIPTNASNIQNSIFNMFALLYYGR